MLMNILYGLATMAVCLILQTLLLIVVIRHYERKSAQLFHPSPFSGIFVISRTMTLLVIGNLVQVGVWATLFILLKEFPDFDSAFYHSAVNFATLGYGDIVMSEQHKILGPLEAINGVLMIGVSTAVMMRALQDVFKLKQKARQKKNTTGQ